MKHYVNTIDSNYVYAINNKKHLPYHCGHISIHKNVFKKHQFIENWLISAWKEDSLYTQQLVYDKIFITYINEKLSIYNH